jgi:hypothetical protein
MELRNIGIMELDARLTAVEERLDALERRPRETREPDRPDAPDAGVFWALDALRARAPEEGAVVLVGTVGLPDGRRAEWQEGLETAALLDRDWRDSADVLAALGHPVRLALLQRFLAGAATVADITGEDGLGTSGQVYHHLRHLVAAGWLRSTGGGRYEVPVARVVPLLAIVLGGQR